MALNLSITQLVIIILSVFALIAGIAYLFQLASVSEDITQTDLPPFHLEDQTAQSQLAVSFYPPSAQEGTVFVITASLWPAQDNQALQLIIEGQGKQIPLTLFDDGFHSDEKAGDGIYGGLFDSQNLAVGKYSVKESENIIGELIIYEAGCQPLIGAASSEKINFLILPHGYTEIEEFKQDAQKLILGEKGLLEIEPFKSNSQKFSFSFLEPKEDLGCVVGVNGIEKMVKCKDEVVLQEASRCHNNGVIVLINSEVGCGTASHYTKICAKSELAGLTLTHELGHSFGNLADEYTYTESFENYNIPDSYILQYPNCDSPGCSKWSDSAGECIPGCTSSSLFRSSENSIMRYVSSGEFNDVSKTNIEEIIGEHEQQELEIASKNIQWKSYSTTMQYKNGEIELSPVYLSPIQANSYSTRGALTANLKSDSGEIIYTEKIFLPLIEFGAESPALLSELILPLSLPFIPSAKSLEITNDQGKILSVTSLAVFSDFCGNNICDSSENQLSCSQDCTASNDNFCAGSSCDPDCSNYEDCSQGKKMNYLWPTLLIISAIIIILVVIFRSRKTN